MALKVQLRPGEQLYIGSGKITVQTEQMIDVLVEGHLPVMREKDYLPAELATTEARRIYLTLQSAYLSGSFDAHREQYLWRVRTLLDNKPSATPWVADINAGLAEGSVYKALKAARRMIQFDEGKIAEGESSSKWTGFKRVAA
jgi:flagellar biosynthesis repressor protein FlbT